MFDKHSKSSEQHFEEVVGAIHLHTTFSDGGINYDELIGAARSLGLNYIVVTDHMSRGGAESGYEGFHGPLMVLVGYEHHDRSNRNHYLVLGSNKVYRGLDTPNEYVSAVKRDGGIGFLAHPAEKRHYFCSLPPYPWTEWDNEEFDGIELWNQMSDWMEHLRTWLSLLRLFYPRRFMGNAPSDLLKKWDRLNSKRFVSAIGGVDAHTRRLGRGLVSITVFPIRVELQGIRTHLYLPDGLHENKAEASKKALFEALRDGHGFISNFRRGDARDTKLFWKHPSGLVYPPGRMQKPATFGGEICVELPDRAEICLIRNGERQAKQAGISARFPVLENGIYRVEAYRKSKAWIYSNPFVVGPTYSSKS